MEEIIADARGLDLKGCALCLGMILEAVALKILHDAPAASADFWLDQGTGNGQAPLLNATV